MAKKWESNEPQRERDDESVHVHQVAKAEIAETPPIHMSDEPVPFPQQARENEIHVGPWEMTPEYLDSLPRHTNPIDVSPDESSPDTIDASGVDIQLPVPPSHLAEEERAYFWHAMDERKKATVVAEQAMNTLTAKRAAADSYRDYLWTKYALGDADSIDTETGLITRHQG